MGTETWGATMTTTFGPSRRYLTARSRCRSTKASINFIGARAAVVTLPVGVLRHRGDAGGVVFYPDLPIAKREALANIEMGHVVKVVLSFRSPFWERVRAGRYRNGGFFRCDGLPFPTYWTQFPQK